MPFIPWAVFNVVVSNAFPVLLPIMFVIGERKSFILSVKLPKCENKLNPNNAKIITTNPYLISC